VNFSVRNPKLGLALSMTALVAAAMLLSPTGAMATTTDEMGIGNHVNDFLGVLTGPIAELVCAILVIIGVILISRGHDMGDGIKTIGTVALGAGVLIGLGKILSLVKGQQAGATIPELTAHVAHHAILISSIVNH
jgi:type IV secretory pathway VirB2 component (pilin)